MTLGGLKRPIFYVVKHSVLIFLPFSLLMDERK